MINRLVVITVLLVLSFSAWGQSFDYGNTWYDPGKVYLKITVKDNGIYRVSRASLDLAGINTAGINAANFHLIYRGKEEYIYMNKTGQIINYFEFYGQRNDGRVDSIMYRDPNTRRHDGSISPQIERSIFSDTSAYFLTWDNNPGLRYTTYNNTNYASFTPETSFRYNNFYERPPALAYFNKGGGSQYDANYILNSDYITAEGYFSDNFSYGSPKSISLSTPYFQTGGSPSTWKARVSGRSSHTHAYKFSINGSLVGSDTTYGILIETYQGNYSFGLNNNTTLLLEALGTDITGLVDNNILCWASIEYDRQFNLGGANEIKLRWDKNTDAYFQFQNTDITAEGVVYDLKNKVRISGIANGTDLRVIVPGYAGSRDMYVATDKGIKTPLNITANHSLNNLKNPASGAEFIIIAHRRLTNSANAYKIYRDTNTVNRLYTKIVYVDEIYDEFGYGSVTPWAIKRFCKYAIDNYNLKPKFFFLWGKGQYTTRDHPDNLVPTFGYPACDYEFVSNFDPNAENIVPDVPIGRVNLFNDVQGFNYLNKIIDYEHTPWSPWMKTGLYLGGGNGTGEQLPIQSHLSSYRNKFIGLPFGGNGLYFYKLNNLSVTNAHQTVTQTISGGISMLQFFGHSNANIYDVDIQEPYNYENWNRYPFIVAFGCYGGDFTDNGQSFGERFVLEKDRGSIGYLANSTAGYLTPLGRLGEALHSQLYGGMLGEPIGNIIKQAFADFVPANLGPLNINHAKQLNLQGDPSMSIYHPEYPDLEITESSIYFDPDQISASQDSFIMKIAVKNLGKVVLDSFMLQVRHQIPSAPGLWQTHPLKKFGPVISEDTLTFVIQNQWGSALAGLNIFDVFVDALDSLYEYDETNNRVSKFEIIPGNTPKILYPYDFAVIDTHRVTLSASSFVIQNDPQVRYVFQIDTVHTFYTGSMVESPTITGTSFYAEWDPQINLKPGSVYYWRVKLADVSPSVWASGSFKYIPGRTGWAQARPPQFYNDPAEGIKMNQTYRQWQFDPKVWELHVFTAPGGDAKYRLNNGVYKSKPFTNAGVMYTPFDQYSLEPLNKETPNNGGTGDWAYAVTPDNLSGLLQAIINTKHGDYFLLASNRNAKVHLWDSTAFSILKLIGCSDNIRSIQDNQSFIILGRKGFPNSAIEVLNPNLFDPSSNSSKLDLLTGLVSAEESGEITSALIGPSISWEELIWDWKTLDVNEREKFEVKVTGLNHDLTTDTVVYSGTPRGTFPLAQLSAQRWPYMRLKGYAKDSIYHTAPQLNHWHVLNKSAPDGLVDPYTNFIFNKDTVDEGEIITVQVHIRNVYPIAFMDSLLIRFDLERCADRSVIPLGTRKYKRMTGLDSFDMVYTFSTGGRSLSGDINFKMEINPDFDQPEMFQFNNYFEHKFHVRNDIINPILDVTFDGKHIMDGDIISPEPQIEIEINDENQYLAVNDTAFEIWFGQGETKQIIIDIFTHCSCKL